MHNLLASIVCFLAALIIFSMLGDSFDINAAIDHVIFDDDKQATIYKEAYRD